MKKKLAAIAVFGMFAAAAHAETVAFAPPPPPGYLVGEMFSLQLSGFGFTNNLDGGGVNLAYDPAVLRLISVTVDTTTWEFFSDNGIIDQDSGLVSDVVFASFEERSGSFPIALFLFETLSAGNSLLTLSESGLNPFASGGAALMVDFGTLSVNVNPIPIPAAAWLLASALAGLGLARRRPA